MYANAQKISLQGEVKYRPYTALELLCTLAHELAHIKHWDHTCHHKMLENHITTIFMQKLHKDGYISEEKDKEFERK